MLPKDCFMFHTTSTASTSVFKSSRSVQAAAAKLDPKTSESYSCSIACLSQIVLVEAIAAMSYLNSFKKQASKVWGRVSFRAKFGVLVGLEFPISVEVSRCEHSA